MMLLYKRLLGLLALAATLTTAAQKKVQADVVIIGGGTGGTAAGIQSARMGARTLIIEGTPWLGGMISAAGVSAIDGNHRLPSGLWAEFRSRLYKVYGGPKEVETGWVSNTLFEPHVADSIFKSMAKAEKQLSTIYNAQLERVTVKNNRIQSVTVRDKVTGEELTVTGKIYIDGTELGDVIKASGVGYDLGMEAGSVTGEKVGVTKSNNIVQDLTYVAILKDFGAGTNKTIPRPANYDPAEFDASCTDYYNDKSRKAPGVDGRKMLEYGKLPNNKYMINWPIYGNDIYLNVVEMTEQQREKELLKAKEQTYRFVYFIQDQLGFKNLGLADDEFPTKDHLALMPYHRESRRVKGLVRFTMRHIAEPFTYGDPLYRTGIAVGDYPIDHHHKKNSEAPQHLEFYPIPSFSVPLGSLIPRNFHNLVVAEKSISVSNVANGTTRLQPCVLLTGQAAGVLAALSATSNRAPGEIPVRAVQQSLLQSGAYLMPYIDVTHESPHFEAIQKVGSTGILKGRGIPFKWANQTWFYPDSTIHTRKLLEGMNSFHPATYALNGPVLTMKDFPKLLAPFRTRIARRLGLKKAPAVSELGALIRDKWSSWGLGNYEPSRPVTRAELAVVLHQTIDPFTLKAVNHKGSFAK